jgi:hypothetical protein
MGNYLKKVGVIGKRKKCNVVFKQHGTIKTDPNKDWLKFTATQYMSSKTSGFIWKARAFPLFIRDKYMFGTGEIKVSFMGLKDLVVVSTAETNQSALGRYFGEHIWFPVAFMDKDIQWENHDASTVKGIITKGSVSVEGYFHFSEDGLIDHFRGKRYRDTTLENFRGIAENYKVMQGLLIPKTMTAIWELEGGNLEYFKAEVSEYQLID